MRGSGADLAILPMVDGRAPLAAFVQAAGKPVLAMIETPRAVLNAVEIAATTGVVGLVAGTHDLCEATGILNEEGRAGLVLALQTMVLAARVARVAVFDGVYPRAGDATGFEAEARQGVAFGFDGKALVHAEHVAAANRIFLRGGGEA